MALQDINVKKGIAQFSFLLGAVFKYSAPAIENVGAAVVMLATILIAATKTTAEVIGNGLQATAEYLDPEVKGDVAKLPGMSFFAENVDPSLSLSKPAVQLSVNNETVAQIASAINTSI